MKLVFDLVFESEKVSNRVDVLVPTGVKVTVRNLVAVLMLGDCAGRVGVQLDVAVSVSGRVSLQDAVAVEKVSLVLMEMVLRVGVAVNEWVNDPVGGEAVGRLGVRVPVRVILVVYEMVCVQLRVGVSVGTVPVGLREVAVKAVAERPRLGDRLREVLYVRLGLAVKVRFADPDTVKVLVLLSEGAVGVLEGVKVSVSGTDIVFE